MSVGTWSLQMQTISGVIENAAVIEYGIASSIEIADARSRKISRLNLTRYVHHG